MNKENGQNKTMPKSGTEKRDESKEAIERGESAIKARMEIDDRPEEIKKKEEEEDAERWRNEG
jgi:hypothetical protein